MINLTKGQKLNLAKPDGTALDKVTFGIGWDAKKGFFGGTTQIDLDANCLAYDAQGNLIEVSYFNNKHILNSAIQLDKDDRTGESSADGDDERIFIELSKIPSNVQTLVLAVTSYEGQTFEKIERCYGRIFETTTGTEICRYTLSEKGSHTALIIGRLYRHNGNWKIDAVGKTASGRIYKDILNEAREII